MFVFYKTNGRCTECERELLFDGGFHEWHVDHVLPVYRGGLTTLRNLQALCVACHSRKSAEEKSDVGRRRHAMTKLGRWKTHAEKDVLIRQLREEIASLRASLSKYEVIQCHGK
ncbi:HNH endonuclease [Roseibium sp. Sym1]|uniref:HNH endonuclease n=1 Tax=Roseibium sp. Sym1 TaxID=3016006 RepID=UPI003FA6D8D1